MHLYLPVLRSNQKMLVKCLALHLSPCGCLIRPLPSAGHSACTFKPRAQETETGGSLRVLASQGYIVKPSLKNKQLIQTLKSFWVCSDINQFIQCWYIVGLQYLFCRSLENEVSPSWGQNINLRTVNKVRIKKNLWSLQFFKCCNYAKNSDIMVAMWFWRLHSYCEW